MKTLKCKHPRTRRGKNIDREVSPGRTRRCLDCKKWREETWLGIAVSGWRAKGYDKATADKPDLW